MNPTTITIWAKVILLAAFFLMSPTVVGSIYAGYLILHFASKYIRNTFDRYIAMTVASLFVAIVAPMFFTVHPGFAICIAFAALLVWVFTPTDKDMPQQHIIDPRAFTDASDDVIEVEVISVENI